MLISFAADGAQTIVAIVFWPLFIWFILQQSYTAVGIVTSLIILVSIVVRLLVGDYTDRIDKKKLLKYGTILYALGWLVKIFVATGFHIFLVSTYHNFSEIMMRTPYEALTYERAADSGEMVDEYAALREIALTFGRVLMILLVFGLLSFTGNFEISFIMAAIASLLINLI